MEREILSDGTTVIGKPFWACAEWSSQHAWWSCPVCVYQSGISSCRQVGQPADPGVIVLPFQPKPPWACNCWGEYSHNWQDCDACLTSFERQIRGKEMNIRSAVRPVFTVLDDFLEDPDSYRQLALQQEYAKLHSAGLRSKERFASPQLIPVLEEVLGRQILKWDYPINGRFQYCIAEDPLVYHSDLQTHAAVLFLTPNAPPDTGITFYRSRVTGLRYPPKDGQTAGKMYDNNLFDRTKWEALDQIANIYNRLVVFSGKHVHAASGYFGHNLETARLFQIFFFDCS